MFDWNSCYMECSAKEGGERVHQVFLELLQQVRNNVEEAGSGTDTAHLTTNNIRRRKSLQQVELLAKFSKFLKNTLFGTSSGSVFIKRQIIKYFLVLSGTGIPQDQEGRKMYSLSTSSQNLDTREWDEARVPEESFYGEHQEEIL